MMSTQEMALGMQEALADLGVTIALHKLDTGADLVAVLDTKHPWPTPLACLWDHGEDGWCCSAPALEGFIGNDCFPSALAASAHIRGLMSWHSMANPQKD